MFWLCTVNEWAPTESFLKQCFYVDSFREKNEGKILRWQKNKKNQTCSTVYALWSWIGLRSLKTEYTGWLKLFYRLWGLVPYTKIRKNIHMNIDLRPKSSVISLFKFKVTQTCFWYCQLVKKFNKLTSNNFSNMWFMHDAASAYFNDIISRCTGWYLPWQMARYMRTSSMACKFSLPQSFGFSISAGTLEIKFMQLKTWMTQSCKAAIPFDAIWEYLKGCDFLIS